MYTCSFVTHVHEAREVQFYRHGNKALHVFKRKDSGRAYFTEGGGVRRQSLP